MGVHSGVRHASAGTTVSPRDFGAAGNGRDDDTAALNQCLAAGRVVDFGGPDSVYLVTGTLLVQQAAPQVLTGAGRRSGRAPPAWCCSGC
jgi:hypothetical protein